MVDTRSEPALGAAAAAAKRTRRRRRLLVLALLLVTILGAGYPLLTRSVFTRLFVMSRIGALLGGEATASRVTLDPKGRIVMENASLRARGVDGEAGEVVSVQRLEAEFQWSSLFRGSPVIYSVVLDRPVARISQSVDDGSVNVAFLTPKDMSGSGAPSVVPRVIVREGAIELGEHRTASGAETTYTALKRFAVAGEVDQSLTEQGASVISFRQVDGAGSGAGVEGGLNVEGRIADDGLSLVLTGLPLGEWPSESTPTPVRDIVRRTALEGGIEKAVITYSYAGAWEARVSLADVALNLPVKARPAEDDEGNIIPLPPEQEGRLLRMQRVNGEIVFSNTGATGKLSGMLEELPYDVDFRIDGGSIDAPFTCHLVTRGFELKARPDIVGFAPGVARRRLQQFGDPTGIVDADVTISRGPPVNGEAAEVDVRGKLTLRGVTAAFERFPYRFNDLQGDITFDAGRIDIVRLDGVAPSGAKITATGTIAPPTESAAVDLDIRVTDLPIDETLATAMRSRRRIIDALFNRERYEELRAAGLVVSSADAAAARRELDALTSSGAQQSARAAELSATLARPVFDLGGRAEVRVQIQRRYSTESHWTDVIDIRIPRAGMLSERVPYPMLANDVEITRADDIATIKGGTYRGLVGGAATISARADFTKLDDPSIPFVPEIEIAATGVPITPLLVHAVPEPEMPEGEAGMVRRMLTAINAQGDIDLQAKVGLSDSNEAAYRVEVVLDGDASRPRPTGEEPRLLLSDMDGRVVVTEDDLEVELAASVSHAAPDGGAPCRATVEANVTFRRDEAGVSIAPDIELRADAPGFDASLAVEDLIRVFSPESADAVAGLRSTHRPSGLADVQTNLSRPSGGVAAVTIDASRMRPLEFDVGGGRARLEETRGSVRVSPGSGGAPGQLSFKDFACDLAFNGSEDGHVDAAGSILTNGGPAPGNEPFRLDFTRANLESGTVRSIIAAAAAPRVADFFRESDPRGAFDLSLALTRGDDPSKWDVEGVFSPRSLGLTLNGTPVEFSSVEGRVEFSQGDGRLRGLKFRAPTWEAGFDGSWMSAAEHVALQARVSLAGESLSPDIRACLPLPVREALGALAMEADGPVRLTDAAASVTLNNSGAVAALRTTGTVMLSDARFDVGQPVTGASGTLDFTVSRTAIDAPTDMTLWTMMDSFVVTGVNMTRGRAKVTLAPDGSILVPHFSADCHGGRLTGEVLIDAPTTDGRRYRAQLAASDVRFASILSDLAAPRPRPRDTSPDDSRGSMSAGITIGGILGNAQSRRGRGTVAVGGGRVLNVPLLVPLLRVSNLQLPINERLDFAAADFYFDGPVINFEELSISSASVGMYGFGTATLPDMELDLRFRSKNRSRIPLVTGMLEGIRDELITAVVRGPLRQPEVTVVTLTGTTKFLGRLFGAEPSEQQKRLEQIEERSERGERRPRYQTAPSVEAGN